MEFQDYMPTWGYLKIGLKIGFKVVMSVIQRIFQGIKDEVWAASL